MDADDLAEQFEDKASVRAGGKPGGGGKQREKQISMALSRLLRHQALNAGIKLDKEGYAPLDRVVSDGLIFFTNT
jgi:2'-phosphotransferase